MIVLNGMSVRMKFNIVLVLILIVLFVALAANNYRQEQELIIKGAVDNARIISRQIIETRDYLSSSVGSEAETNPKLVPQVAATEIAREITRDSNYYVRQVSLRYRNPHNRPDVYETDRLKEFMKGKRSEVFEQVPKEGKSFLRYMLPMVADKSCLTCHGSFENAPAFVRDRFPRGHYSYGYRVGDVIGAVSVTVPIEALSRQVEHNFRLHILYDAVILVILAFVSGWIIRRAILEPIKTVSEGILAVARNGNYGQAIEMRSNDEIGDLISSFNELSAELERKTIQRKESEDRYRNIIEIAQSPIVTFMSDGKIVITNHKAEELFGIKRQEILGQSMFDFMERGDELKEELSNYFNAGKSDFIGATVRQRLRDVCGRPFEADMVISVSSSDQTPIFSAILRPVKQRGVE